MGDLCKMRAGERLVQAVEQREENANSEEDLESLVGDLVHELERRAVDSTEIDNAAREIATNPAEIDFPN